MSRGSKLSRMVSFFKEADLDEADYVMGRALTIVNERKSLVEAPKQAKQAVKRRRKPVQQAGTAGAEEQLPLAQGNPATN